MQLFGYEITRKKGDEKKSPISVIPPVLNDGSTIVNTTDAYGAYYAIVNDMEINNIKDDNELIRRYRDCAQYADADAAIEDIINEAINTDGSKKIVELNLDDLKLSDPIKKKIISEFDVILKLLKFSTEGSNIFRNWYVDGKLYYHTMFEPNNDSKGIVELRYVDPRKIKKVKDVEKVRDPKSGVESIKVKREFYVYSDTGIQNSANPGSNAAGVVPISLDAIVYVPSGLSDPSGAHVLSYLHKAVKFINMLKMMEDALVIYRYTRAPERRIFYIDTGALPPQAAEKYLNDIMNKYKNKVSYDSTTGEIRDSKNTLSMMEDFWIPRRGGGTGTEITTLPGGQSLSQIDDIQYFQQKVYQALNVPLGRMQPTQGFSLGRSTEIGRDEIKFNKFVEKLRSKFNQLFLQLLKIQLTAKNILSIEDWDQFSDDIKFTYNRDNFIAELKENEVLTSKLNTLALADPFVGKYFSVRYVQKHILNFTEEQIEEEAKQMAQEYVPEEDQNSPQNGQDQEDEGPDTSNDQPFGVQPK